MQEKIIIKGAREHNLKGINLSIPRGRLIVITGPSGSGKSSLAMDTLYAEGQRRYVQSLSAYARQFLEQLQRPEVDWIEGLSPSIAIEQKTVSRHPRSTVGTITEIYDYMRVLYTRIGKPSCWRCGTEITTQEIENILDTIMALPEGTRIQVLSPIVRDRKGEYKKELQQMRAEGFIRARIDGKLRELIEEISLERHKRHTIEIVVDRLIIKPTIQKQLKLSIESALRYADTVVINLIDEGRDIPFSKALACPKCGVNYPEIAPRLFSFNSKMGACEACNGLGFEGIRGLEEEGIYWEEDTSGLKPCRVCNGMRLRREALSIKIGGLSIGEFSRLSVNGAISFLEGLNLTDTERHIAQRVLKEVMDRLGFLNKVGLGYLSMDRPSLTLSGGEAQRIRLATQIGSSLTGVLYVLDEPSIGLHPRDCKRLLESLYVIRDRGNTVIVVEHDEETIRSADYVIDMGPGAGHRGGWIVAEGSPSEISKNSRSITGRYLSGALSIELPRARKKPSSFIKIRGASIFNLKNIDVDIPLGVFVCITGVSGSGKSTLVHEVLYKSIRKYLSSKKPIPTLIEAEKIDKAICVEQAPLGRTPRSNPATYTGVFTFIRELFSLNPEARLRGYTASRFSFNLKGGRCEVCKGDGLRKIEMHFLPDVYIPCDACKGKRYNKETLQILYKGKTISDVLEMTVSEAREFFEAVPQIRQRLEVLEDVGLGYLKLGQPATTLSGGEAQRIRLTKELSRRSTGNTLYILDEPTTGLHFVDIERLLHVIRRLVERGNSVIVIEHNLDVVKSADYIIDLGPEGGEAGGRIIAKGTPEEVASTEGSYTGEFLRGKLR